jgi:hypothetical protein
LICATIWACSLRAMPTALLGSLRRIDVSHL